MIQSKLTGLALGTLCALALPLTGCEDSATESSAKATPEQIASFKDSCTAAGGMVHTTAGCNGTAVCKGSYLDLDHGTIRMNECAGKNSCRGIQCLEQGSMSSSSAVSSQALSSSSAAQTAKTALLAAPTAMAFNDVCQKNGGKVSTQDCNGHNTCKGMYFHTGAYGTKVGAAEVACQGHNTCAGSRCEL